MVVRIRMSRHGKRHQPYYRVVAASSEKPRDGNYLEVLGWYDPRKEGKKFEINLERYGSLVKNGAKPSETVLSLLKM